jgi:hypothetical protein
MCMTVPEAAVHPYRKPMARKNEVGVAGGREANVQAEPETCAMKGLSQQEFGKGIRRGPP